MSGFMKRISVLVTVMVMVALLAGTIPAEAATKWVFSTSNGVKKTAANGAVLFIKGEYQDMNIYRNGKQIKENDATYSVTWYSSDSKVMYVDKKSGKLRADKNGTMKEQVAIAKITAVVKNKKTGGTTKKSFSAVVTDIKAVPTPTPIPVKYNQVNALMVELPDCTNISSGDVWIESEVNIQLQCAASMLPEQGILTAEFAYQDNANVAANKPQVELFIGNVLETFGSGQGSQVKTKDGRWSIFSKSVSYELSGETCVITIKTHSGSGEASIPFAIANLIFEDSQTGEKRRLDLQSSALEWQCKRFTTGEQVESEWVVLQIPSEKVIPTFAPLPTATPTPTFAPLPTATPTPVGKIPTATGSGSKDKYITYQLPESEIGWEDAWSDSESNIIMRYTSEKMLSQGTVYAKLYIPELEGTYREDSFELAIHADDNFMNFSSDRVDVSYAGGGVSANGRKIEKIGKHYEILMTVTYGSDKVTNGNELSIIFKTHSDTPSGGYEISISDIVVVDNSAGTQAIDYTEDYIKLSGKMYASGEPVSFRYTNELTVPQFHITNAVDKLILGKTHQLEIEKNGDVELRYSSSDSSVASIDGRGKISTHKAGRCTITVTDSKSGESKRFAVTVDEAYIVPVSYEILMLSGSSAKFEFFTDFTEENGVYQYRSSDSTVVSVLSDGSAKAHKEGVATITVTDTVNGVSFSFELAVYAPKDPDGIAKYLSLGHTNLVTVDIAKRSYDLLYAVYQDVFDYFNYGEYEPVVLNFTVGDYSPAYSNSADIFLSSEHMLSNSKDVDCITHELIHCAQNHISVGEYVWLMEGLTDYGRYLFGLHNADCGWSLSTYNPSQHYTNSYTVTAAFLKFVTENYCKDLPHIINKMFKEPAGYDESIWVKNTGYTIDELWDLYAKS